MFQSELLSLPSGAIAEIRAALSHLSEQTKNEFEALKMRTENLEFRATGFIVEEAHEIKTNIEESIEDVVIDAEHVGMTFKELVYALAHPVRAARALRTIEAQSTALGSLPPSSSSSPDNQG